MKSKYIHFILFFIAALGWHNVFSQGQRIMLTQLEKAPLISGSRAGMIGLSNAAGDQRYAFYVNVGDTCINYTPTPTGNSTVSIFVQKCATDSIWYIDWEGRSILLAPYGGSGGCDTDFLEIGNNECPDAITDSIYKFNYLSIGARYVWPEAELLVLDSLNEGVQVISGNRNARLVLYDYQNETFSTIDHGGTETVWYTMPDGQITVRTGGNPPEAPGSPQIDHFSVRAYDSTIVMYQYPNTRIDTSTASNYLYTTDQGVVQSGSLTDLAGFIPVTQYGAVLDGTTDVSAAVQTSIDAIGYAFFPYNNGAGNAARINSTIVLHDGQAVFSNNRSFQINSGVPADSFLFRIMSVPFYGGAEIHDLSVSSVNASGVIDIFQCRQVNVYNVKADGDNVGKTAIQIRGDDVTGNAWNSFRQMLILDYNRGFYAKTSGTSGYNNAAYVENVLFQSCDTAVVLWRANTNYFSFVSAQAGAVGFKMTDASSNWINTRLENQTLNSILSDAASANNIFSGSVSEPGVSDAGVNEYIDANYTILQKIAADLYFKSVGTETYRLRTAVGSTDTLAISVRLNDILKFVYDGGSNGDYVELRERMRLASFGQIIDADGRVFVASQTVTLANNEYDQVCPLPGSAGIRWYVPNLYDGWELTAIRYSVGNNTSTTNIRGGIRYNGSGTTTETRNLSSGAESAELTTASTSLNAGDYIDFYLENGTSPGVVNGGYTVTLTLSLPE